MPLTCACYLSKLRAKKNATTNEELSKKLTKFQPMEKFFNFKGKHEKLVFHYIVCTLCMFTSLFCSIVLFWKFHSMFAYNFFKERILIRNLSSMTLKHLLLKAFAACSFYYFSIFFFIFLFALLHFHLLFFFLWVP